MIMIIICRVVAVNEQKLLCNWFNNATRRRHLDSSNNVRSMPSQAKKEVGQSQSSHHQKEATVYSK